MSAVRKFAAIFAMAVVVSSAVYAGGPVARVDESRAAQTALAKSGGGSVMEVARIVESGRPVYQFLIVDGGTRHDVAVESGSGDVVHYSKRDIRGVRSIPMGMAGRVYRLSPEEAERAAISHSGGGLVVKSDMTFKANGGNAYAIEVIRDNMKYVMEIDATSGRLLNYEEKAIAGKPAVTVASK